MKRIAYWGIAGALLVTMGGVAAGQSNSPAPSSTPQNTAQNSGAQTESLGAYARQFRKEKKPDPGVKTFNNDNLPKNDALSVVGPPPSNTAQTANANDAAQDQQDKQQAAQAAADWKAKIADQQSKIDLLTRELNVLQGEYKLRAAAFYGDAGNRLRDQGAWDKEDADYKQKISDKQKALNDAQKELDDMQEQARKAQASDSDQQ
jgi:hypothetical protein